MRRVYGASLLLAVVASAALAAPPEVPTEIKAEPGQLVRIVVKTDAEIGYLKNFTDADGFFGELVSPKGQRQFVFQPPAKNPRASYTLGFWTKGETEGTATTIVVSGVTPVPPGPGPQPPTPPDPDPKPDGFFGLRKVARENRPANAAGGAKVLADWARTHSSAVAAGASGMKGGQFDPATALSEWGNGNVEQLPAADLPAWEQWGKAVQKQFFAAYQGGKLKTKIDYARAFTEIADGLEDK